MKRYGHKMSGNYQVAANIISLSHLWNSIRVQGGAYGASMSAGRTGSIFCHTYRDPSPGRSLGIFKTISDFLSDFAADESLDIDGFIISTIASTEPLLSPAAKGRSADDFYLSGFTDEDRIRIRKEILNTKAGDLAGLCDVLRDMSEKGTVCVVGPKAALESCEDLEISAL
jgi:Zn-dependent M16 (insulinase) family peptidase